MDEIEFLSFYPFPISNCFTAGKDRLTMIVPPSENIDATENGEWRWRVSQMKKIIFLQTGCDR